MNLGFNIKKSVKKVSAVILVATIFATCFVSIFSSTNANAKSADDTIWVSNASSLTDAVSWKVSYGGRIALANDITLSHSLYIQKPLTIDLQGHKLKFFDDWNSSGCRFELQNFQSATLENGVILGDYGSGSRAISVYGGNVTLSNVSVFGGNANSFLSCGGRAMYISYGNVYLDYVHLQGGDGFSGGLAIDNKLGNIFSIGRGYTFLNGLSR